VVVWEKSDEVDEPANELALVTVTLYRNLGGYTLADYGRAVY
jgi:hypothetical protein